MGKIALVIGHNSASQGAVRATDKRTEYDWNGSFAVDIMAHSPGMYRIFRRTPGGGYSAEIKRVYAEVDAWGADASVELHFNALSSTSTGTETLTSGSTGSMRLAKLIQPAMVDALELKDRGLLVRKRTERGGASLFAGRAPAVLIEPYFGSNRNDCAAADRNYSALTGAIHQACVAFLKG